MHAEMPHEQAEEFTPRLGGPVGDAGGGVATGGAAAGGGGTGIAEGGSGGGAGGVGFGVAGVCGAICGITIGAAGGAGADGDADCGAGVPVCGIRAERCGRMLRSAGVGRCTRVERSGRAVRCGGGERSTRGDASGRDARCGGCAGAVRCGRLRCVLPRLAVDCAMHAGAAMSSHSAKAREVRYMAAPLIMAGGAVETPADANAWRFGLRTEDRGGL